jgi:hypothetical protein
MPAPPRRDWPLERRLAVMEAARRQSRFKAAKQRIRKISAGDPPLTDEQRAELAEIILAPAGTAP